MESPAKRQRLPYDTRRLRRAQDAPLRRDGTQDEQVFVDPLLLEGDAPVVPSSPMSSHSSPEPTRRSRIYRRKAVNDLNPVDRRQESSVAAPITLVPSVRTVVNTFIADLGASTTFLQSVLPSSIVPSAAPLTSILPSSLPLSAGVGASLSSNGASVGLSATALGISVSAPVSVAVDSTGVGIGASISASATLPSVPTVPSVPPFPSTLTVPAVPSFPSYSPLVVPTVPSFPYPDGTSNGVMSQTATTPAASASSTPPAASSAPSSASAKSSPAPSSASRSHASAASSKSIVPPNSANLTTSLFTSTGSSGTITGSSTLTLSSSFTPSTLATLTSDFSSQSGSGGGGGGFGGSSATAAGSPAASSTAPPVTNNSTTSTGAVVGGVVGGVAGSVLIVALVMLLLRWWKTRREGGSHQQLIDGGDHPSDDAATFSRGPTPAGGLPTTETSISGPGAAGAGAGAGAATAAGASAAHENLSQDPMTASRSSILPLAAAAGMFWDRMNRFSTTTHGSGSSGGATRPLSEQSAPRSFERVPGTGRKLASPYSPGLGPGGRPEMTENPFANPRNITEAGAAVGVGAAARERNRPSALPALSTENVRPSPARTPTVHAAGPHTPAIVTPSRQGVPTENPFLTAPAAPAIVAPRDSDSHEPRNSTASSGIGRGRGAERDSETIPASRDTIGTFDSQRTSTTYSSSDHARAWSPGAPRLPRPTLGRSHPSADGSRGSRFTEEMT